MPVSRSRPATVSMSTADSIAPDGLCGLLIISIRVLGVIASFTRCQSGAKVAGSSGTCTARAGQVDRRLVAVVGRVEHDHLRSEEHTSELQSLMRISYAVFCLKKKKTQHKPITTQKPRNNQHPRYTNTSL